MMTRSPLRTCKPLLLTAALAAGLSGAASAQEPYPYNSYPRGVGPGTDFPTYVKRGDTEYFCRAAPVTLPNGSTALGCRPFTSIVAQNTSAGSAFGPFYQYFSIGAGLLLAIIAVNGGDSSSGTGTR